MGQYEDTRKELRSLKKGCICAIMIEIMMILAIVLLVKTSKDPLYVVEKWWFVAFFACCVLSNFIEIYKANVAINSPEILINIKW